MAPLLPGVINRVKAIFAGRKGQPLLQLYYDLWKLLGKGAVYSRTTSWVFRAGPVVGLAAVVTALLAVPLGPRPAPLHFAGDLVLVAYLLGLARFFTVIAALDTGSAFEGMGASREVAFSALAEPALLLGLAALSRLTGSLSLSGILGGVSSQTWAASAPELAMIAGALMIVFLAENARIPVDDPNTHLELTMIHEVMVLDHSGPDFAYITYAASLKFLLLGSILIHAALPNRGWPVWIDVPLRVLELVILSVIVGVIESSMARLRLSRVSLLLAAATVLSALGVVLTLTRSLA
jgi:formate hydrogenlyase subunit 4